MIACEQEKLQRLNPINVKGQLSFKKQHSYLVLKEGYIFLC